MAGLRVIDSTDERGELCSRLLADLGADVIRTEAAGGSGSRHLPPFAPDGTSLSFAIRNANKRGVTVDLDAPEDRDRLHALLATADIWIENKRPSELAAAGLDLAAISASHRRLVIVSFTDFGLTGPYREFVATDDVLSALSGVLFRSGIPSKPPLLPPGSLAYDVASVSAAFAALAAVWQRQTTGRGQTIDVSALLALAQITDWSLPNWAAINAMGAKYSQQRAGSGPVYPLFPCASGYVRLIILTTRQWHAFRAWIGEPEILQDPHWDHVINRLQIQNDILSPIYAEFFKDFTAAELATEAQHRGIVMTPVLRPSEVLAADHFVARGTFAPMEYAPGQSGAVMTGVFEIDHQHVGPRTRAPEVGEHDIEVFAALDPAQPTETPTPTSTGSPPPPSRPFTGLKVLDFGHGGVGVEAGRLFVESGADVIKVESWTYPDFIRGVMGTPISPSFVSSSRLKRSFSVNVKTREGLRIVEDLVRWADVVIENNSTGTMDAMGLGYDRLRELNPAIVMVSSQLMGSTGPWKDWIGYGPSTRPAGGMTHLWSFDEDEMPPGSAAIHPDHLVGRVSALAALAGLIGRSGADGAGLHAEIAQVDTVIALLADLYLQESLTPGSVKPEGNSSERDAPWGVFPCAAEDTWCVITIRDDGDWQRLAAAIGRPAWTARADLATKEGRLAARAELDELLAAWTRTHDQRELMELLQAAGVPAAYMALPEDMSIDPHFVARDFPQAVQQPALGSLLLEGSFFTATGMPPVACGPAALLGEHTREICREVLGLADSDVDALIAADALRDIPAAS
ncbi:MAG TPA: CoA transferase [Ilumatobacteraceae bacterium]